MPGRRRLIAHLRRGLQAALDTASAEAAIEIERLLHLDDKAFVAEVIELTDANPMRFGCPSATVIGEFATGQRDESDPHWDHVLTCAACRRAIVHHGH